MKKKEKKSAAAEVKLTTSPKKDNEQSGGEEEQKVEPVVSKQAQQLKDCLLYTSPSPRDGLLSRMPSSA